MKLYGGALALAASVVTFLPGTFGYEVPVRQSCIVSGNDDVRIVHPAVMLAGRDEGRQEM